jgi:DNA polymerase-3 subunit epsilon
MESKNEEEINGEENNPKSNIDWSKLNDIETLISQKNKGKKVRCIVFDTETTGVNHKKDHILELACVEVVDFGLTGRTFHIYIKPRVFVPKKVQEINHINYDDYKKYWEYYNLDTKTQLQNFLDFVGEDSYLVAHNATFDYYFINSELRNWGLPELSSDRFRCTLRMTKKLFKSEGIETPNFKLNTLCDYFKILVNDEGLYHNGLFDTTMTSKLLIHLYKKFANINDVYNNEGNNKYAHFHLDNLPQSKKKEESDLKNLNNNKDNFNENGRIKEQENDETHIKGNEINKLIQKMNEMVFNKEQNNNGDKKDQ